MTENRKPVAAADTYWVFQFNRFEQFNRANCSPENEPRSDALFSGSERQRRQAGSFQLQGVAFADQM